MKKIHLYSVFFTFVVSPCLMTAASLSYDVDFEGIEDAHILKSMKSVSQLVTLKKKPPDSLNALRYRAETDTADFLKVLHAHGYYEAVVSYHFEEFCDRTKVKVHVEPGPAYSLTEYSIFSESCVIKHQDLGITLDKQVDAQKILLAELKILQKLSECGYPFASIKDRKMIVDGENKTLRIQIFVDSGTLYYFGTTKIEGEKNVREEFISQKVTWDDGEVYDARRIEETQRDLLSTGLFSSVLITHVKESESSSDLTMRLDVKESKHRSIFMGVSYQTVFGPGASFGWENRNVSGLGRKFSIKGEVTRISHYGLATYHIPDFRRVNQDLVWQAQALQEDITAYNMHTYNFMGRVERKFTTRFRASMGGKAEELLVRESVDNGNFFLLEVPFYFRWSSANDLLNPTQGSTFQYIVYPAINFNRRARPYLFQEIIQSFYLPLTRTGSIVLAQKITVGSILSSSLNDVPVPKRFLGGSEEELRGYKYRTVSPLNFRNKPIGGRSAIYYTLEARLRVSSSIGLVPFFDIGNVYLQSWPNFGGTWRKSLGLGLRFFSYFGPLRFDIGFPLDRRKDLDSKYRLFVSIGQMF
jgi:translocation and assembly module TamA